MKRESFTFNFPIVLNKGLHKLNTILFMQKNKKKFLKILIIGYFFRKPQLLVLNQQIVKQHAILIHTIIYKQDFSHGIPLVTDFVTIFFLMKYKMSNNKNIKRFLNIEIKS